jgi:hypothetical protein
VKKWRNDLGRLILEHTHGDIDPGRPEPRDTAPCCRIRVTNADYDSFESSASDRVHARRRLAEVCARLERHVQRSPAGIGTGAAHGVDFGVRATELPVRPFADHVAILHDQRAHHRIG